MDLTVDLVLVSSLVIGLSYFIRSVSGFGGTLLSNPLLSLFFPLKFLIPLQSLFELSTSIPLVPHIRKLIRYKSLARIMSTMVVGTFVGTRLLSQIENNILTATLGVIIILISVFIFLKPIPTRKYPKWLGYIVGFIAGVSGGVFGINGPPIVIYLSAHIKSKREQRATLLAIFTLDALWRSTLFLQNGSFDKNILSWFLVLLPVIIITTLIGQQVHLKIERTTYKKLVGSILLVAGILVILQ